MDDDKKESNIKKLLEIDNFSKEEIDKIYKASIKKELTASKDITLKYVDVNNNCITLRALKNRNSEKLIFYKNPVVLNINQKEYNVYTPKQCKSIIKAYDLKNYLINVDGIYIKSKSLDFNKIKKINIEKLEIVGEESAFKEYIVREKCSLPKEKSCIEINKKFISLYFDEICISPEKEKKTLNIIFDQNRVKLINKITEFLDSENKFYLILGTDGIGKTVTVLYYTASFSEKYKNLYLNLKFFLKNDGDKRMLKKIFFDELKRLFITYDNSEENIGDELKEYQSLIKKIEECEIKSTGIKYFWELLNLFILKYDELMEQDILIVLDQYKNKDIDEDFGNLNEFSELICSAEITNKIKLMILISINNYDTKNIFLENLSLATLFPLSYENTLPHPIYTSNIHKKNEINTFLTAVKGKEKKQDNYEFDEIEKYLDIEEKKIQDKFKGLDKNFLTFSKEHSKLQLNSKYREITKKDYINEVVDCSMLIKEDLNNNYKNCLEVFGYSLKYYNLLLSEINNKKKLDNNININDDDFARDVVKDFYQKVRGKIIANLNSFYEYTKKDNEIYTNHCKINSLITLDNSVYSEKIYSLEVMKDLLSKFPVKYLNIFIVGFNSPFIPLDNLEVSKFGFMFDYSNNFVRETIHQYYLSQYLFVYKTLDLGGSGFGALFEELVNKKLKSLIGEKAIERYVFSIVGTGTKNYIDQIREKENLEFYKFYNINKYNVIIDGIDLKQVTNKECDFLNNDIIINQLSQCGRSFDIAILKKLPKDKQKDKTHDLILLQDTKDKVSALKSKEVYKKDGRKSRKFLEKIYEGLKINKIYLIFIIPKNFNVLEMVQKLKNSLIYYLQFDTNEEKFCKGNSENILDFRIKEADITIKEEENRLISALSDIKKSKFILNESSHSYIGRKRMFSNKFINIYNKICHDNAFNCISVVIPIELKKNIIKEINIISECINFIPSTNCLAKEIENIFKHEKNIFIFSYKDIIYFFYKYYYIINEKDFSITKTIFRVPRANIVFSKKDIIINSLSDIKKYPLFCICYIIIENHNFNS